MQCCLSDLGWDSPGLEHWSWQLPQNDSIQSYWLRDCKGMHTRTSLGTRPLKNQKEGLVNWLGWKCTLCPVCRCTSDWLRDCKGCALIRNANRMRAVFAFCFVLECCYTKWVQLEHFWGVWFIRKLYWLQKVQQLIKFLTFCSVHFHPTQFIRPSFSIFFEGLVPRLHTYTEQPCISLIPIYSPHFTIFLLSPIHSVRNVARSFRWLTSQYLNHVCVCSAD